MHTHQKSSDRIGTIDLDIGKMRALWPWIETGLQTPRASLSVDDSLANKLARIAWAVLTRGRDYEPRITA